MPSRGIPACSSRRSKGGSVSRFGAGLVMSQTEMAALRLPRASSANGGAPIGRSSADSSAAAPVGDRRCRPGLQNAIPEPLRKVGR